MSVLASNAWVEEQPGDAVIAPAVTVELPVGMVGAGVTDACGTDEVHPLTITRPARIRNRSRVIPRVGCCENRIINDPLNGLLCQQEIRVLILRDTQILVSESKKKVQMSFFRL